MKKNGVRQSRASDTNYLNITNINRHDKETPFPTEQCKKCLFWRQISFLTRACHYTLYTGKLRSDNPPTCSAFIDKDSVDKNGFLEFIRDIHNVFCDYYDDTYIDDLRKEVSACEESEE